MQERLDEILDGPPHVSRAPGTIAAVLASLVVVLALAMPPTVAEGIEVVRHAPAAVDCD